MAFINGLGVITLPRGDCFKAPLFLNIGTEKEPIRLEVNKFPELEVYFGVYPFGSCFEKSFLRKKFSSLDCNEFGDVIISINPEDTLSIKPGNYLYTIKARMFDKQYGEWVATVIDANTFQII